MAMHQLEQVNPALPPSLPTDLATTMRATTTPPGRGVARLAPVDTWTHLWPDRRPHQVAECPGLTWQCPPTHQPAHIYAAAPPGRAQIKTHKTDAEIAQNHTWTGALIHTQVARCQGISPVMACPGSIIDQVRDQATAVDILRPVVQVFACLPKHAYAPHHARIGRLSRSARPCPVWCLLWLVVG